MYSILYTSESEDNLAEIFEFIARDNTFYAAKVLASIKNTIDILKLFPLAGTHVYADQRMIVDTNYGYKILYCVSGDSIVIVTVSKHRAS